MKRFALMMAMLGGLAVQAQASGMDMGDMKHGASTTEAQAATDAVGVVNAIDQRHNVVTITHEPIKSLGWSAMTMDFLLADPGMLKKVSVGKKVQFRFVEKGEDYVIVGIK